MAAAVNSKSNKSKNKVTARSFRSRVHYNPSPDFGERKKSQQDKSNAFKPLVPPTPKKWPAWKPIPSPKPVTEPSTSTTGDYKPLDTVQSQVNLEEKITKKDPVENLMPKFEKEQLTDQQIDEVIWMEQFKQQCLEENFMKIPNVNAGDPLELLLNSQLEWPMLSAEWQQFAKTYSYLSDVATEALTKLQKSLADPESLMDMSMPPPTLQFASPEKFPAQTAAAMQPNLTKTTLESEEELLRFFLGIQPKSDSNIESLDCSRLKQCWQPQQPTANLSKEDLPAPPQAAKKFEAARPEQTVPPKIDSKPTGVNLNGMEYLNKICTNLMNNLTNPMQLNNPTNMTQFNNNLDTKFRHNVAQFNDPPSTMQFNNATNMSGFNNPAITMQFNNYFTNMTQFNKFTNMAQFTNHPNVGHNLLNHPPNMMQDPYGLSGLVAFAYKHSPPNLVNLQAGAAGKPVSDALPSFSGAFGTAPGGNNVLQNLPSVPKEYNMTPQIREKLNSLSFTNFSDDVLFLTFYHFLGEEVGIQAAQELFARNWRFHKEKKCWMTPHRQFGTRRVGEYEYGWYVFFDPVSFKTIVTEACIKFSDLEIMPRLLNPVVPPEQTLPAPYL